MTYLSGKAHKKKQNMSYVLYALFFISITFFWLAIKSKTYAFLEPVVMYYADTKKSIQSIPEFFATYTTSHKTLMQKTKTLEITVENLENELATKKGQLQELGFVTTDTGESSLGKVLVMYPLMNDMTRIYSTIVLSKGFKDGVEKDAYVYVRGLQPVCSIKEVYTSTALCELLTADHVTTEGVIVNASTTLALTLVGRGGGTFIADVARDTPVFQGDTVMLKSDQSMTLGKVVEVLHNNQDTSWHVLIEGAYNPMTSSIFYIYKK